MPEAPVQEPPAPPPPSPAKASHDVNWRRRLVVGAAMLVAAVLTYIIGAAFVPRWWAHRIGDQVAESSARGVGFGLFYGFLFTLLPLVVLWIAFHKRRPFATWAMLTGLAAVLAIPNLLTLGIVLGDSDAAHDGERILSTEANFFRGATLAGVIAAIVVFGIVTVLIGKRRHRPKGSAPPPPTPAPS